VILKDGVVGESRKIRELGHYLLSLTVSWQITRKAFQCEIADLETA
jgi:hypothetical protein